MTAAVACGPLAVNVDPPFLHAIGAPHFWHMTVFDEHAIAERLRAWLRRERPFVETATGRCYDNVQLAPQWV